MARIINDPEVNQQFQIDGVDYVLVTIEDYKEDGYEGASDRLKLMFERKDLYLERTRIK